MLFDRRNNLGILLRLTRARNREFDISNSFLVVVFGSKLSFKTFLALIFIGEEESRFNGRSSKMAVNV